LPDSSSSIGASILALTGKAWLRLLYRTARALGTCCHG